MRRERSKAVAKRDIVEYTQTMHAISKLSATVEPIPGVVIDTQNLGLNAILTLFPDIHTSTALRISTELRSKDAT